MMLGNGGNDAKGENSSSPRRYLCVFLTTIKKETCVKKKDYSSDKERIRERTNR